MAQQASEQLLSDVQSFLHDETYSDLTITCGTDTYNVHKLIVCKRSEFFARAVKFGKEAAEAKVNLPEDEPATIRLLVNYLYKADYEPRVTDTDMGRPSSTPKGHTCRIVDGFNGRRICSAPDICSDHYCGNDCEYNCKDFVCKFCHYEEIVDPANQLLTHAKMYEIGDKYQVSGLKELAMYKFQSACNAYWDHIKFPEAATYAFSTTPNEDKGLRDIICKTISKHMSLLEKPEVEVLMTEFNGLAYGLLKEKSKEQGWGKEYSGSDMLRDGAWA